MADNFGLKIGLEGEKEFKKSISEINQTFKVLGSEMKLVTAQFDKNDNSIEALTARQQVLGKEVDAQRQKVETLRAALANATESFGENDRRTQQWQIQLNNAEAALIDLERQLDESTDALDKAGREMDDTGDQADDMGDEVDEAADEADDAGARARRAARRLDLQRGLPRPPHLCLLGFHYGPELVVGGEIPVEGPGVQRRGALQPRYVPADARHPLALHARQPEHPVYRRKCRRDRRSHQPRGRRCDRGKVRIIGGTA